ncbi:MAG TPA: glycosyltransferase family 4 protein [Kiritimatiellia bacterium]|mgnify:CR=1 FL=1|nr:glycosyltransferase family 4 protein [Kiritimatiellia bacterium]
MDNRAIFFGFSFRHHGPHTAFHGLAKALSDQIVVDASPPWPSWTPHAIEWRLNWRWLRWSENRLHQYYREADRRVIHYFFPENTMRRAAELKRHHALIATCHQPIERLWERKDDPDSAGFINGIRSADMIVVQCESHIEPYREFLPNAEITTIPLGMDATFFKRSQPYRPARRPRILTVGNWLRDYATWAQTVKILHRDFPDLEVVVVANADTHALARKELGNIDFRVTYLRGISDEALRLEYEKASVFFLPLTSAMANDALLEALAMGAPMVVTDLSATRDYAGDAALYIPPASPEAAATAILDLLNDQTKASDKSGKARKRAETLYDWPPVAAQYRALYQKLK